MFSHPDVSMPATRQPGSSLNTALTHTSCNGGLFFGAADLSVRRKHVFLLLLSWLKPKTCQSRFMDPVVDLKLT